MGNKFIKLYYTVIDVLNLNSCFFSILVWVKNLTHYNVFGDLDNVISFNGTVQVLLYMLNYNLIKICIRDRPRGYS